MTTLSLASGFVYSHPREDSNSSLDFLAFIVDLIIAGHIRAGDIVILDNASVHWSADNEDALMFLFNTAGARLVFLPPYSPELNPAELLFNMAKSWLKRNGGQKPLLFEIIEAFAQISATFVLRSYLHSIWSEFYG